MKIGAFKILLLWLLALAPAHASTGGGSEDRFRWNEANARLANAREPAQYREAAALYAKMVDSGTRRFVFVSQGDGFFEPRPVEIGTRANGLIEITKGLAESNCTASTVPTAYAATGS